MKQKTLVILKPDSIKRGITGEIISRFENKGLKLVGCKMKHLDEETLEDHYRELKDKPFFPAIINYMTSGPVILQVREGVEAVDVVRLIIGVTNSRQAQPGTIRGDFGISIGRNVVHASESEDIAKEEIERFFYKEEILTYEKKDEDIIYEEEEL